MSRASFKAFTAPSGAYIEAGPHDYQLYASVPGSDALVVVLEMDIDCPGRCFTYFMRGGIAESCMTVGEFTRAAVALTELARTAHDEWPALFDVGAAVFAEKRALILGRERA